MSFGRHQSFYFKESWPSKALKSIKNRPNELLDKDGYVNLGIGSNMQQSLRFWIESSWIAQKSENSYVLSEFGNALSNQDVGCLSKESKILIHYFLVSKISYKNDHADSFEWFFRTFPDKVFSKDYLEQKIVQSNFSNVSTNTLKRDIDCLLSTYLPKDRQSAEDRNISLLDDLGLIKRKGNLYMKSPLSKSMFSFDAFMYIFGFQKKQKIRFDVESQMTNNLGIGKAFNFTRIEIIELIESMNKNGYDVQITRTNNLDTIALPQNHPMYELNNLWRKYEN